MSLTNARSLVVVAILALRVAFAQLTSVSCLSSFDWMNNTKSQNPCLVASYLISVCVGTFTTEPLPEGTVYGGPTSTEATGCACNTVTYSLFSACGDCQDRTFSTWNVWSSNCTTSYNASFPMDIPSGTAVPHWAYLDVTTSGTFNPAAAQLAGDTPESTATQVSTNLINPSSTVVSASLTSSPTTVTSSSAEQSSTSPSKDLSVGAIAGGIAVGVVGIAVMGGLAAWLFIKCRRSNKAPSTVSSDTNRGPGHTQSVYSANPNLFPGQLQVEQHPRLYDPTDPSTFPSFYPSPTIQATSATDIYQNSSIPSQIYTQQHPGRYSGVPEVSP